MKQSDLYLFIWQCLCMDDVPGARERVKATLSKGPLPWERFVFMSSAHLVTPAVYSAFLRNGMISLLPEELASYLEHIHALNLERNQRISQQIRKVTELISDHGMEPVLLKGAGRLMEKCYPDPGDRLMIDIDILIAEPDTRRAWLLLQDAGYAPADSHSEEDYEKHHHLPALYHSGEVAFIELHSTPVVRKYKRLLPVKQVMATKVPATGCNAFVMPVHTQMTHLFIHEFLTSGQLLYGNPMLRTLFDLKVLRHYDPTENMSENPNPHWQYKTWVAFADQMNRLAGDAMQPPGPAAGMWTKYVFHLASHPRRARIIRLSLKYFQRAVKIITLFATAPFDRYALRYIRKKAGTRQALYLYFKKLYSEFKR